MFQYQFCLHKDFYKEFIAIVLPQADACKFSDGIRRLLSCLCVKWCLYCFYRLTKN